MHCEVDADASRHGLSRNGARGVWKGSWVFRPSDLRAYLGPSGSTPPSAAPSTSRANLAGMPPPRPPHLPPQKHMQPCLKSVEHTPRPPPRPPPPLAPSALATFMPIARQLRKVPRRFAPSAALPQPHVPGSTPPARCGGQPGIPQDSFPYGGSPRLGVPYWGPYDYDIRESYYFGVL